MGRFDKAPVDRAAGGVVIHGGRVVVIHRPRYRDWSLPKGHVDDGESWAETAVREVREETGLEAVVDGRPLSISYFLDAETAKVVVFYPMVVDGPGEELSGDPEEVDEVAWWSIDRAIEELSYPDERWVLASFVDPGSAESQRWRTG